MPTSSSWFKALFLGVVIALFGAMILIATDGYTLEEHFGLDTLFKLRGPLPPADEVVIIAIEKSASTHFNLPNNPAEWPRDLHARLIDKLTAAGVRSISFDLFFRKPRNRENDQALANAIDKSGRVILFAHTHRITEALETDADVPVSASSLNIEQLIPPVNILGDAAAALAPFALPKYPLKVTSFWTYRAPAGDIPNIPAVALQLYSRDAYAWLQTQLINSGQTSLPDMDTLIARHSLRDVMMQLRTVFHHQPRLAATLTNTLSRDATSDPALRRQIAALIALYSGSHRPYLNFYGPPWTLNTIPYHTLLTTPLNELDLRDKAVFVGFSERLQPEQLDNFNTVYSLPSGLDLSGVEIAATAFANLLYRQTLKPLPPLLLIGLVVLYGFVVALLARLFKPAVAISTGLLLAGTYVGTSSYLFSHNIAWLPWVVPVLIQTPLTLFLALGWHYFDTQGERKRIRRAFGLYLPDNVVNEITRQHGPLKTSQNVTYGIVLATDAERYTRLAEQMPPAELGKLLNRYYALLFKPTREHGGIISDVVGDSMMAIWSTPRDNAALRQQACLAALGIQRNIQQAHTEDHALPTRIGLHAGEISLGNVGAGDHYEYRAVGDIVNTASRIEGINKLFGTYIIASADAIRDTAGLLYRELGNFRLPGKTHPVVLFEILNSDTAATSAEKDLCARFLQGVSAYRDRNLTTAITVFNEIRRDFPDDGPAKFYAGLCQQHQAGSTNQEQDGTIRLSVN